MKCKATKSVQVKMGNLIHKLSLLGVKIEFSYSVLFAITTPLNHRSISLSPFLFFLWSHFFSSLLFLSFPTVSICVPVCVCVHEYISLSMCLYVHIWVCLYVVFNHHLISNLRVIQNKSCF